MLLSLLGWIGALLVMGSYLFSVRKTNPDIFHWGNVIGCVLLVPVQLIAGVPFAAFLSFCFGFIATLALYNKYRHRNHEAEKR